MEDTGMHNPFWDGFEKQAGLARFLGQAGAKATSAIKGTGSSAASAAGKGAAATRHAAGSPSRFLTRVKGAYHGQRAKQLNMPVSEYKKKFLTTKTKPQVKPDVKAKPGPKEQPSAPKPEASKKRTSGFEDLKNKITSSGDGKLLRNTALVGAGALGGAALSSKSNQGY